MITIEEYLRGKSGVDVSDTAIAAILFDRGIEAGAEASQLSRRQLDLATADLYRWLATAYPSTTGARTEQDGDWKSSIGGTTVSAASRTIWRKEATRIYTLYGEPPIMGTITIINL